MKHDDADRRIESDLKALAATTARGLPTLETTARDVADARAPRSGGHLMSIIRSNPWATTAVAAAVLGAVLVCPVPYTSTLGYELTVTSGGRVATLRVPVKSAAEAERRAAALRRPGTRVSVAPRTRRVWGSVYAMAKEKLLDVRVSLDGKSDAEVADDIRAQLAGGGWTAGDVQVQRSADGSTVEIEAQDANGRQMKVVRKASGGSEKNMDFQLGGLDAEREPGMTDAELRDKILEQLEARGLQGEVTIGEHGITIRASKELDQDAE